VKIIDVLTIGVNLGDMNHVFVKVLTDEHLQGIGEVYRVGPDDATERTVHHFREMLIGQDPTRIEHLWQLMYNTSRFPGGSVINAAISGIEIALWDLKGKILGVPVYQLLGGRCRDKVRVYRSIGGNKQQIADDARKAVEVEGYTALKMGPFSGPIETMPWNRVVKGAAEQMEVVRKAVGDDIDIALDPHARIFEPVRAWQISEAVRPFSPFFFEEGVRPENVQAMAALKRKAGVPIATGEELYTKFQFRDLLAAEAADIIQPDLLICGGLLEGKKIAALAEAFCVTVAPHNPMGPFATAVSVHFAATLPNFCILEYVPDHRPPSRDLLRETVKFEAGYLKIPEGPGLGVELNEKAFAGKPLRYWHRPVIIESDGNVGFN
jgi:galactonate dehydratase